MFEISNISVAPLGESPFVKPREIHYTLNGICRKWDYIQTHASVSIIILNVTRQVLVCVKQFRPAVYIQHIPDEDQKGVIDCKKYPAELGLTLEFCAGIMDKNHSCEEIAKAEIMEETGYDIPVDKLERVRRYRSNVGASAGEVQMFYVEVEDHMKTGEGGGLASEGEFIEIVEIPVSEARKMCDDPSLTNSYCGFLFGLIWFFHYKAPTKNIR